MTQEKEYITIPTAVILMKEFRTISGNKAKFQINTISKSKLKANMPKK